MASENKHDYLYVHAGPAPTISISDDLSPDNIIFHSSGKEMIRISKDGFYCCGEKLDDVHNIYERFHEWLKANKF